MYTMLRFLLSLFLLVESLETHSTLLSKTFQPLSPRKKFLLDSGLPRVSPTYRGLTLFTFSKSPVLVKNRRQAVPDTSSTQKRTARSTFLQTLNYQHFFSQYSFSIPEDFDNEPQELQVPKEKLLTIITDSTCDLS